MFAVKVLKQWDGVLASDFQVVTNLSDRTIGCHRKQGIQLCLKSYQGSSVIVELIIDWNDEMLLCGESE